MSDSMNELSRLQEEIAELKRQLERQHIHASILGVDTIRKYDEAMEQFQKERDDWKRRYESVVGSVRRDRQRPGSLLLDNRQYDPSEVADLLDFAAENAEANAERDFNEVYTPLMDAKNLLLDDQKG